jgi:hypothetical protein
MIPLTATQSRSWDYHWARRKVARRIEPHIKISYDRDDCFNGFSKLLLAHVIEGTHQRFKSTASLAKKMWPREYVKNGTSIA